MMFRFFSVWWGMPISLLLVMAVSIPARSHTHINPDGSTVSWYPAECCSNGDCRPVASVEPTPEGLLLTTVDGHMIVVSETHRRKPSRDNRWHVCLGEDIAEEANPPHVRCIFEPPNT